MFTKKSIGSRVMAKVKEMIDRAQKACDEEIAALEVEFEQKKLDTEEKYVANIMNKIIN